MGVRRTYRQINRLISQYGFPDADGPGDPILRRTLIPTGGVTSDARDEKRYLFGTARNAGGAAGATDLHGLLVNITAATQITLNVNDQGRFHNIATTNVNTESGIDSTLDVTRRDWFPELVTRQRTGAHANTREWVGFFSANPMLSDTPAVSIIGFRASASVPDTNWQAVTSDGVSISLADTGAAFLAASLYVFHIDGRDSSNIRFRVDTLTTTGPWVTLSTNLPALTTGLFYYQKHRVLTASVGTAVNLGFFHIWTL